MSIQLDSTMLLIEAVFGCDVHNVEKSQERRWQRKAQAHHLELQLMWGMPSWYIVRKLHTLFTQLFSSGTNIESKLKKNQFSSLVIHQYYCELPSTKSLSKMEGHTSEQYHYGPLVLISKCTVWLQGWWSHTGDHFSQKKREYFMPCLMLLFHYCYYCQCGSSALFLNLSIFPSGSETAHICSLQLEVSNLFWHSWKFLTELNFYFWATTIIIHTYVLVFMG